MTHSITCDSCGTTVVLDRGNREAANGEDAAWIQISARGLTGWYDACTRSCAAQMLDSGPFSDAVDAQAEVIASIARSINEEDT